ncbi:hypothetical protein JCM8097_004957 [Rhodosporidiobolus ruineniae]
MPYILRMNYFGQLNEWAQLSPWRFLSEEYDAVGPSNSPTFTCHLIVWKGAHMDPDGGKKTLFKGQGGTKKEAKQHAAYNALVDLGLIADTA